MIEEKELSNYEKWQLSKFGNIIPSTGIPEDENGNKYAEEFTKWVEDQEELFLHGFES